MDGACCLLQLRLLPADNVLVQGSLQARFGLRPPCGTQHSDPPSHRRSAFSASLRSQPFSRRQPLLECHCQIWIDLVFLSGVSTSAQLPGGSVLFINRLWDPREFGFGRLGDWQCHSRAWSLQKRHGHAQMLFLPPTRAELD